jgi:hypothetical protein
VFQGIKRREKKVVLDLLCIDAEPWVPFGGTEELYCNKVCRQFQARNGVPPHSPPAATSSSTIVRCKLGVPLYSLQSEYSESGSEYIEAK